MDSRPLLVNTRVADVLRTPTPPATLLTEIVNTLNDSDPERLRDIASYAEALAEHKEREARLKESAIYEEAKERPNDLPDDVPAKVTVMIKEINDNGYYWQWRDSTMCQSP
jgi:hypothetical protein